MISRQELEGHWDELKGRLQEKWGQLTDDELQQARGNTNQLVGVIERKTGQSRREIEDFIDGMVATGQSKMKEAVETAGRYAGQATDAMREQYDHMAENVRAGYERAGEMVRRSPVESVAVAFGAGIITGVVVGLMMRR
jgi:uncharacterized protein YjbJ (UPF0337 family)